MLLGFVRDRTALFFTILFPLMFLVLFGGLFKDSRRVQGRRAPDRRGGGARLDARRTPAPSSTRSCTSSASDDAAAALEAVRNGDVGGGGRAARRRRSSLHYSAADPVRAGTVRSIFSSLVSGRQPGRRAAQPPQFTAGRRSRSRTSRSKTIQFITPGLLGWAVATGATFGAALTLVTWRQKKILRRLRLAPVQRRRRWCRPGWASASLIALVQTAIFIGVALLPFFGLQLTDLLVDGDPADHRRDAGVPVDRPAGRRRAPRRQEAASAIANIVVLPMAFLSGVVLPAGQRAAAGCRRVSQIFPLRHLNDGMLDVMVRGRTPDAVLPEIGILLGFAVVVTAIASRLFKWDDI